MPNTYDLPAHALLTVIILTVLTNPVAGADQNASATGLDFSREILPILSDKCFTCHGPDAKKKELRLDSYAGATADLGGYQAINPKKIADSEILVRLFDKEDPMPPKKAEKQITEQERDLLVKWVKSGGVYEKHWAYVTPKKPQVPSSAGAANPIDAFIAKELKKKNLTVAPEADRPTLARRAALTLIGLPPTPEQLTTFINDKRADAYERYVDGLLASPEYGVHQARYWLDAARYGDTHGLHMDNRRAIYPYRDWVVRALNANQPFDEFITWQLAGDLLPEPTQDQLIASGFVRLNPSTAEGGAIPDEFQAKNNFDRTENFGTVFLGMTLTCARCHTHKYDPITQTEYFELFAFFNNTAESPMDGNKYDYQPVITVMGDYPLPEGVTPPVIGQKGKKDKKEKNQGHVTLIAKESPKPRVTKVLHRGEYDEPVGDPLQPGVFSVMSPMPKGAPANRLGLAHWLTARDHPLVARVLINRVWQQAFGYGLVRTPEDFGVQGEYPTNPELLDWLAVEFQDQKWDLKKMIRLLVTSKTFRQQAKHVHDAVDPQNKLWSRGPSYRLDAEVIRDIALWSSGRMVTGFGGEGFKPPQPKGLWSALMHPKSNTRNYEPDHGETIYRRSLYMYWKRTSPHPMLTLFDAPSRESACVRRSRSNTPLQSLALFNETQRVEFARLFAERLIKAANNDDDRMTVLFTWLTSREPTTTERTACKTLLSQMLTTYKADKESAAALLAIGETKCDAALESALVAAWTQVALVVLGSDAVITLY